MDYEWLWLVLAAGVFAAVAIVPASLAFDALNSWREYRARLAQHPRDVDESVEQDELRKMS
jgi:hypothetical protein